MMNPSNGRITKTVIFTLLALIAFAANSVLCRMALGGRSIDPSSFTIVRLVSGVLVLAVISRIKHSHNSPHTKGSWTSGFMLFLYAVAFSFAYITLDTGTGALILFGSVQITMILLSLLAGDRLHITEWTGGAIAFSGFIYLILPGVTAPSTIGFMLMAAAGIGWGVYTLRGRGSDNPLMDTTYNFLRTIPLVIILAITAVQNAHYSLEGVLLALLSGGIASGIGYTIWYSALGGLSSAQAAVVQLSVPVIAALGGVVYLSETITLRLALSAGLILGGILMVVLGRHYFVQVKEKI